MACATRCRNVDRRIVEEVQFILDDHAPDLSPDKIEGAVRRLLKIFGQQGWANDVDLLVLDVLRDIALGAATNTIH